MITIAKAIKAINPNVEFSYIGNDISSLEFHTELSIPENEIQAKIAELQAEYDAQEYARKREAEYPSIQECVHAILDDDLDALQAKRADIKTKYPKG
jgi:hypothetical protein